MKNELNMRKSDIGKFVRNDNIPEDEARSALTFSLEVAKLNTGRVQSAEELEERFTKLFEIASKYGKIPRYEHLSLVSGIPKRTLFDYRK